MNDLVFGLTGYPPDKENDTAIICLRQSRFAEDFERSSRRERKAPAWFFEDCEVDLDSYVSIEYRLLFA
jgi:hypothetical protein